MKNGHLRLLTAITASAAAFLSSPPTFAQVKKLDVPAIHQEGTLWCWAASAQMVMIFLGADSNKVLQCTQVSNKATQDCCPNASVSCDFHGDWPDFKKYGFVCKTNENENPLSFEQLRDEIDHNRPVAFSWHWGSQDHPTNEGGHMLVAAGYKISGTKKYVWVLDPLLNPNPTQGHPHGQKIAAWKSYDFYDHGGAENYYHWNDFFEIKRKTP